MKLVFFLRKSDAEPEKGSKAVEVVRIMYDSPSGNRELESCKKLHVGGSEGSGCRYFQVTMTNLLQKHWEWQEDRRPMIRHSSVIRPTVYLASMDIKTAFDVAGPKLIARIMEEHNVHGWIIAALLRERSGLV